MHRWIVISAILLCAILLTEVGFGQDGEKSGDGISINGTSSLTGFLSTRQGFGQEIPAQYLLWNLRGSITVAGVPFTLGVLASTMQKPEWQPMNFASFQLDNRSLLKLEKKTAIISVLRHFEVLELGRARPVYSPLMLSGIGLDGMNVGFRAGNFFTSFAYGRSLRSISSVYHAGDSYRQEILYGRVGLGKAEHTIFQISLMQSKDDESSLSPSVSYHIIKPDTFVYQTDTFFIAADSTPLITNPQRSILTGAHLSLVIIPKKLTVHGELVGSLHNSNTLSEQVSLQVLPIWLQDVMEPNLSTSLSYAYRIAAEADLPETRTHFMTSVMRTAPGFQTPGVPFLREDLFTVEASGRQILYKKKLQLQAFLRYHKDNLSGFKGYTTQTLIAGFSGIYRPVKWPFVSFSWSPHYQYIPGDLSERLTSAQNLLITAGKSYLIRQKYNAFTALTWSNQRISFTRDDITSFYHLQNLMLQQTFMLSVPLIFQFNAGYYLLDFDDTLRVSDQISLNIQYMRSRRLKLGVGVRYLEQEREERRLNFQCSGMVDLGKWGQVRLMAEPIVYRNIVEPSKEYRDYRIQITLVNRL